MVTPNQSSISERNASGVEGIHHVEVYVSDLRKSAQFYCSSLGLQVVGTVREIGVDDRSSVMLERGEIRLLLTSPLHSSSPVAQHIRVHGEGVKDIALSVSDVDRVFHKATSRGARPIWPPSSREDEHGVLGTACIAACGDLVHSLLAHRDYSGPLVPGLIATKTTDVPPDTALDGIDHIAFALNPGELEERVEFYVSALGFRETHQEDVMTEHSAMRSKVVQTPSGSVRFPLMEPAAGRRKSQIEAYIKAHEGSGAQHLALLSHDIRQSVSKMMLSGTTFLSTPGSYYEGLEARVGKLSQELDELRKLGVLVDRDARGLLFQIFTKPIGSRPTLFLEVIERRGSHGFGSGNIKALFEAVEREDAAGG
jgi:4-hydroxyphenylpyruvate dioxygenase